MKTISAKKGKKTNKQKKEAWLSRGERKKEKKPPPSCDYASYSQIKKQN